MQEKNTPLGKRKRDEDCYGLNFLLLLLWRHLPENWQLFLHQKINQKKKDYCCKKNFSTASYKEHQHQTLKILEYVVSRGVLYRI